MFSYSGKYGFVSRTGRDRRCGLLIAVSYDFDIVFYDQMPFLPWSFIETWEWNRLQVVLARTPPVAG